ncbi:TonB-dependent receptor plug domain-containing protein [Cyclobacterium xiamenense]|uniref:TonB-dependent receptor plug domain-containing protein n=1 Tax=Cyclobacterium xiamenense TaxID=1297121 RepID=UPI0035CF76DE
MAADKRSSLFLVIVWLLLPMGAFGQDLAQDTVDLDPVEVAAVPMSTYAYGQRIRSLDLSDAAGPAGGSLGDLLQDRTGLFIRTYGSGMSASLSMRGTSAGHNALFWNGLPVNSPSLGQADYSVFPMAGLDQVDIHYGSAGALYGTDAIGGAVHLTTSLSPDQERRTRVRSRLGSFGNWGQEIRHQQRIQSISFRTSLYRNVLSNHFPYRDWASPDTPVRYQDHAEVQQQGWIQDIRADLGKAQVLQASLWLGEIQREIQPVLGSVGRDTQKGVNLRAVVDYIRKGSKTTWNIKTGVVHDRMEFNGALNLTRQALLAVELDWKPSKHWQSRSGVRYSRIQGDLSTYSHSEQRIELYQATNYKPLDNLGFSLQLRQLVHEGQSVPFTPGLGVSWTFLSGPVQQWEVSANASKGFKVPTLNDRFWMPGGNPDLASEQSWSKELGLSQHFADHHLEFSNRISLFHMSVDNWIIWLPEASFWTPKNVRKVVSKGLEYFMEWKLMKGAWGLAWEADYAWTRTSNRSVATGNEEDLGKQLPYVPRHKLQLRWTLTKGRFSGFASGQYTGQRFVTSDNRTALPAYTLWGAGISQTFSWKESVSGTVGLEVRNLWNTDYQVLQLRSMPGRNFQLTIQLDL